MLRLATDRLRRPCSTRAPALRELGRPARVPLSWSNLCMAGNNAHPDRAIRSQPLGPCCAALVQGAKSRTEDREAVRCSSCLICTLPAVPHTDGCVAVDHLQPRPSGLL